MSGHEHLDDSRMHVLLGYRLARAATPGFRVFDKFIGEPFGLRRVDYSIMVLVDANVDVTPKRLAHALNISVPYLTITLDKMSDRGLLERERSETDRRSFLIRLTPEGQAMLEKAEHIAGQMEQDLLSCLTKGEQGILFEILAKIAAHRPKGPRSAEEQSL